VLDIINGGLMRNIRVYILILMMFILLFPLRAEDINITEEELNIESVLLNIEIIEEDQQLPEIEIEEETENEDSKGFFIEKLPILVMLILLCSAVIYYILHAGRGKEFFIRKIAGLDAIDEAVGRATEMGKPILFVPGIGDLGDMQTLAALTILGILAEKVADYNAKIIVPCRDSVVMSAAREIVKNSYIKAGHIDEYNQDDIYFITDDQFGYVAGVDGIMVREKPATNFLLGTFFAESLILAETGFSNGAIQISGTAHAAQIPFFVAACDYTLIGEELLAASAYMSKDPFQIGSLKGQDFGKILAIILILIGVICEIAGWTSFKAFFTIN
jgi:hypothetical protein